MNKIASNIVQILKEQNKPMRPIEIYKVYIKKYHDLISSNHLRETIQSTLQLYSKDYRKTLPNDSKFHKYGFDSENDDLFSIVETFENGRKIRYWTLNEKNNLLNKVDIAQNRLDINFDVKQAKNNDEWCSLLMKILLDESVSKDIKEKLKELLNI